MHSKSVVQLIRIEAQRAFTADGGVIAEEADVYNWKCTWWTFDSIML